MRPLVFRSTGLQVVARAISGCHVPSAARQSVGQLPSRIHTRTAASATRFAPEVDAFTAFEHRRWESAVSPYDRVFGRLTRLAAKELLEKCADRLKPQELCTLLDCATGPGYVVEAALARAAKHCSSSMMHFHGVDFSAEMLRSARDGILVPSSGGDEPRRIKVEWLQGDIQAMGELGGHQLPGGYDVVLCNFGVLHLGKPEAFFKEAFRMLRPGGVLGFTVWAQLAESLAFQVPLRAIEQFGSQDVGLPPGPPFFKYSDAEACKVDLLAAGFEKVTHSTFPMEWTLRTAEEFVEVFAHGTARTGALIVQQSDAARQKIEEAMRVGALELMKKYPSGVPQPCVTCIAQRPT